MPAPTPKVPQTALKNLARQFLEHLEIEKNRSKNTVQNYDFYLGRFITWASRMSIVVPNTITLESVREYRLYLNRLGGEDNPLKKNTQNYHLIALRSFLKYLAKRDITTLAPEKIELAKMPQRTVAFLDEKELVAIILATAQTDNAPLIKLRDRAILELLFSTGMRVSELAGLKRTNVNLEKNEFTVHGKGDKYRIVFLSTSAKEAIAAYLKIRTDAFAPLFTRHDRANQITPDQEDQFLTPRSIQRLVHRYALIAGITKEITPHTLRHSFATDLLMNGADIRSVQAMLGHASITSTQIYTHVTNQHLREVHETFHGRRQKKA